MKALLRNIAVDLFMHIPLIYFGLLLHSKYAYNISMALYWFIAVGGIVCSMAQMASGELLEKARNRYVKKVWIHKKYSIFSRAAKIIALFALGYFWLGGFFMASVLFMATVDDKISKGEN